jgi:hypothetical protein
MKTKLLLILGTLLTAPFASAQIQLHDFSAFESPTNTFFLGDWELTGDAAGSTSPRASFVQEAGFYTFSGGTDSDMSSAFYFFDSPIDITGHSFLQLTARLETGNTAPAFTITLFDSNAIRATAVVASSTFEETNFSTFFTEFTFSAGFNTSDLAAFQISGNVFGGDQFLNFSVDNLALSVPVPEPSTYGLIGGAFIGVLIFARRIRRSAR